MRVLTVKRLGLTWRILWDAIDGFNRNDGSAVAGYIAFTGLMSIFPFLIALTMLIGTLIGAARSDQLTQALFDIAPSHVAMTLEPVIDEVVAGANEGILLASAFFAVYLASSAIEAFRVAFDRAYRVIDPRGFLHARAVAVLFVLLGAVVSALLGGSILLTPLIVRLLESAGIPVPGFVAYLANAFGLVVFGGFVYLLHRTLPGRSMAGTLLWPGVVVTTVVWLVAATGFSIYLGYTPTYSITYGALAGVIITLMFFYITAMVIIFGAELNASLNRFIGRLGRTDIEDLE